MLSWWTLNIPGIQFHTSETVIESALFFLLQVFIGKLLFLNLQLGF